MFSRNQKFCSVLISSLILLGCSKYDVVEDPTFYTEKEAAIYFFKSNISILKGLTKEQEMLGYVMKCGSEFKVTTPFVGELVNYRKVSDVRERGCTISAGLHTHPVPDKGWTMDFFSEPDIKTSHVWRSYLLSQENCNVRFGHNLKDKFGTLLGKLEVCK